MGTVRPVDWRVRAHTVNCEGMTLVVSDGSTGKEHGMATRTRDLKRDVLRQIKDAQKDMTVKLDAYVNARVNARMLELQYTLAQQEAESLRKEARAAGNTVATLSQADDLINAMQLADSMSDSEQSGEPVEPDRVSDWSEQTVTVDSEQTVEQADLSHADMGDGDMDMGRASSDVLTAGSVGWSGGVA